MNVGVVVSVRVTQSQSCYPRPPGWRQSVAGYILTGQTSSLITESPPSLWYSTLQQELLKITQLFCIIIKYYLLFTIHVPDYILSRVPYRISHLLPLRPQWRLQWWHSFTEMVAGIFPVQILSNSEQLQAKDAILHSGFDFKYLVLLVS